MLKKVLPYPPSHQARRDALLPELRSRLEQPSTYPKDTFRAFLACGLGREVERLGAPWAAGVTDDLFEHLHRLPSHIS